MILVIRLHEQTSKRYDNKSEIKDHSVSVFHFFLDSEQCRLLENQPHFLIQLIVQDPAVLVSDPILQ